jgi:hypothetical protein
MPNEFESHADDWVGAELRRDDRNSLLHSALEEKNSLPNDYCRCRGKRCR